MFILDTNVVSELRKVPLGKANANVRQWASGMEASAFHLSAITIHELEVGDFQSTGVLLLNPWLEGPQSLVTLAG